VATFQKFVFSVLFSMPSKVCNIQTSLSRSFLCPLKKRQTQSEHPTWRFAKQHYNMTDVAYDNNEQLDEEKEEESDEDLDLKQAVETQQTSP